MVYHGLECIVLTEEEDVCRPLPMVSCQLGRADEDQPGVSWSKGWFQ